MDVDDFEKAVQQAARTSPDQQILLYERALNSYGGDLLPGNYSEWLLGERERLRQVYRSILTKLAGLFEDRRDLNKAVPLVMALLRMEPLDENACTWLMRLFTLQGNRGEALHLYHTFSRRLRRELNVEPSSQAYPAMARPSARF